jgi:ABC-type phosphate/phosphonate transport system substrate-binding protein
MYDRAETAQANDALWALIRNGLRARGLDAPEALTRGDCAYWPAWESHDLLLSQTCGLPFRAQLHRQVTLVGTPDYGVEGCAPGYYRSVLIARRDDPRQTEAAFSSASLAYNEPLSQSGWAAVHDHFQDLGLTLCPTLQTGSHRASALAVAEGAADFAAIDAVTWTLLARHEEFTDSLRVFAQTKPTPGLPLITAQKAQAEGIFESVAAAIANLTEAQRCNLSLRGVVPIPASAYLSLAIPPSPAQKPGIL